MTRFMLVICLGFFVGSVWAEQTREDFVVHEADGPGVFRLTDARGKYVALHFLLKTTCPHCLGHTVEYTRRAKETPEVVHVFLKPDTEEEIRKWSVKLDKKWAQQMGDAVTDLSIIYRDPDAELTKLFEIPNGYKFHGQGSPATRVGERTDVVAGRLTHCSLSFWSRPTETASISSPNIATPSSLTMPRSRPTGVPARDGDIVTVTTFPGARASSERLLFQPLNAKV